jgi:metal-responsive CopG/Arc/MetJ family transcriptional regulator
MAQLNVYVPDKLAEEIRKMAKREGKSLSAFLVDLVRQRLGGERWPKGFFTEVVGRWKGEFPEVKRPPPEEREGL